MPSTRSSYQDGSLERVSRAKCPIPMGFLLFCASQSAVFSWCAFFVPLFLLLSGQTGDSLILREFDWWT
jgi:hypothetical protein